MSTTSQNPYAAPQSQTEAVGSTVFKLSGMVLATFFGGPLATGYLLYRNLRTAGQSSAARYVALLAPLLAVLSFWFQLQVPPDVLSQLLLFLPQVIVIAIALNILHGKVVKAELASGAIARSNWSALGVGVACHVILLVLGYLYSSLAALA